VFARRAVERTRMWSARIAGKCARDCAAVRILNLHLTSGWMKMILSTDSTNFSGFFSVESVQSVEAVLKE